MRTAKGRKKKHRGIKERNTDKKKVVQNIAQKIQTKFA
jgi:hypothetical protein